MPTINETIYAILTASAPLAALVGTRVYPVKMPQKVVFPAIVFAKMGGPRAHSNDGSSGFVNGLFAFDCWGVSQTSATAVEKALKDTFDGYRDVQAGGLINGAFAITDPEEGWDDKREAAYASVDYQVLYNEPNGTP